MASPERPKGGPSAKAPGRRTTILCDTDFVTGSSWRPVAIFTGFVLMRCGATLASGSLAPIFDDDFETGDSCAWGAGTPTCPGIHLASAQFSIDENDQTVCYHFRTPNEAAM